MLVLFLFAAAVVLLDLVVSDCRRERRQLTRTTADMFRLVPMIIILVGCATAVRTALQAAVRAAVQAAVKAAVQAAVHSSAHTVVCATESSVKQSDRFGGVWRL